MSTPGQNINFSLEYALSIIVVLVVCNYLIKSSPQMNSFIVIIAGLLVGYISLLVINTLFPAINNVGSNGYQYYSYMFMNNFNNMGYMHVWPPILVVLIIFIVLLYSNQLG
jgi:ABC-type Fe3+-siderophore transport system permease subunit